MDPFNLDNEPGLKSGFKTPDDYFDRLEDRVMAQLAAQETIPLFVRYRKVVYAAAAVLVLALMVPVYHRVSQPSEKIDDAALEHYLAYESGLNQFDLLTALDQEDINSLQQQSELPVSDEAIEEVLSTNNIEHILTE